MKKLAWALGLSLACRLAGAAALPPAAEALRPAIQKAEQRLQGASLQLEAARHDAQPLQAQVDEARAGSGTWWGAWFLKRRLGQLKLRLDAVEEARAAQVAAHQDLVLLLTGADEEMSGALEQSLAAAKDDSQAATWAQWWRQKEAWQERLAALQPAASPDAGGPPSRILKEALQIQAQRERALLDSLARHHALSAAECAAERSRQKLYFRAAGR